MPSIITSTIDQEPAISTQRSSVPTSAAPAARADESRNAQEPGSAGPADHREERRGGRDLFPLRPHLQRRAANRRARLPTRHRQPHQRLQVGEGRNAIRRAATAQHCSVGLAFDGIPFAVAKKVFPAATRAARRSPRRERGNALEQVASDRQGYLRTTASSRYCTRHNRRLGIWKIDAGQQRTCRLSFIFSGSPVSLPTGNIRPHGTCRDLYCSNAGWPMSEKKWSRNWERSSGRLPPLREESLPRAPRRRRPGVLQEQLDQLLARSAPTPTPLLPSS